MLATYATGAIAVVLIALAWVAVQGAWKRAFPERGADPDALAGRIGCHGDCEQDCDHRGHSAFSFASSSGDRQCPAVARPGKELKEKAECPQGGREGLP